MVDFHALRMEREAALKDDAKNSPPTRRK